MGWTWAEQVTVKFLSSEVLLMAYVHVIVEGDPELVPQVVDHLAAIARERAGQLAGRDVRLLLTRAPRGWVLQPLNLAAVAPETVFKQQNELTAYHWLWWSLSVLLPGPVYELVRREFGRRATVETQARRIKKGAI
ncbi:MAG TPA: hypothetical protein VFS21_40260 [Roseiflexaceae bacterium]|nr:hypothetical protein [Roseiflexaceae bacterium]